MTAPENTSLTSIRKATEDDTELVYNFIRGLAEYEKLLHEAVLTPEDIRQTLFGQHPYAAVLIAEHDGSPAGFALYFHKYSTFLGKPGLYLEDLYVNQDKRGLGIGKSLLQYLASICAANDYERLEWCVLDWNQSAIKFYDDIGAQPMNDWLTYRLDADGIRNLAEQG